MNKRNRLIVSIIVVIILIACACPAISLPSINDQPSTNAPLITTHPEIPTNTSQPTNVLLSDDFSVESVEIQTFSDESGSGETKDGVYILHSKSDRWNWGQSNSEFSDTLIEFDATITIAPVNNNAGAGIICRMHIREDTSIDGYLFAISGDGFYSIRGISSSAMDPLVDWTYSDTINQGNQGNKIRATCNGSELKLEVNGELLATASTTAAGPQSGTIAFASISLEKDEPNAEVQFDNLLVSKP